MKEFKGLRVEGLRLKGKMVEGLVFRDTQGFVGISRDMKTTMKLIHQTTPTVGLLLQYGSQEKSPI